MVDEKRERIAPFDDLEWLEPPYDRRALDWGEQRTGRSRQHLQGLPLYEPVREGLEHTLQGTSREPIITVLGSRALRLLVTSEHPLGLLQTGVRDDIRAPGPWRTVLDVDDLRKQTGIPYELVAIDYWLHEACLPPDYSRCLLRLAPGGGVEVAIREFDLENGEFVRDGFEVPTSRVVVQWLNRDLVLIGDTANVDAPTTTAGLPAAIKLWRRGQPINAAEVVYQAEPSDCLVWLFAAGTGNRRYGVISRAIDFSTYEVRLIDQNGRIEHIPIPKDSLTPWTNLQPVQAGPRALFLQLRRDVELAGKPYAARALLTYSVDAGVSPRARGLFAPESGDFVDGPAVSTRDHFAFVVKHDLVSRVVVVGADGDAPPQELMRADAGQTITRLASDHESDDIVVAIEGFVTPRRQILYRTSQPPRVLAEDVKLVDATEYLTEIGAATSRDGTKVDYYLLKPRVPRWKGAQPLLVTGYAAFGTSFTPTYFTHNVGGPSLKLWLERGGSLLIPAARGGGERGDAWHRAAMRERRQNSYDDFICVLEKLNQTGYTQPSHTGIFGSSNGGLLAAVLGIQRPDLFGAVVCDVPLTDLMRMKYMGVGGMWTHEYGDPDDASALKVLVGYSPLQNVRAGVKYPPFLITVSTSDSCVGPGHGRKLAARLEAVGADVHFYEAPEGGHGVSDPYRNSELMALRMTFLITSLMNGNGSQSQDQSTRASDETPIV
jgi:prolyl oligopeptidase